MQYEVASFRSIYSFWYKSRESSSWLITVNLWAFFNIRFFKKIITANLIFFIEGVKQLKLIELTILQVNFSLLITYIAAVISIIICIFI